MPFKPWPEVAGNVSRGWARASAMGEIDFFCWQVGPTTQIDLGTIIWSDWLELGQDFKPLNFIGLQKIAK